VGENVCKNPLEHNKADHDLMEGAKENNKKKKMDPRKRKQEEGRKADDEQTMNRVATRRGVFNVHDLARPVLIDGHG
jgi:hypothetical protein